MKHIILITDCRDIATEQIKARFSRYLEEFGLDYKLYCAYTPPFQITNGMFLSKLLSEEVPAGENTLYLAILNPLKNKPKRIFGKLKDGSWFVGADTGIFSLLFQEKEISELRELTNQQHYPFGGLHIHTTLAANLLCGKSENLYGSQLEINELKTYFPVQGEVIHIDNFGLVKLWLRKANLNFEENTPILLRLFDSNKNLKKEFKGIYANRMMNYKDDQIILYPGSSLLDNKLNMNEDDYRTSGLLEIGLVRNSNSSKVLNISLGDVVEIIKEELK